MRKLWIFPLIALVFVFVALIFLSVMPGRWLIPPIEKFTSRALGAEVRLAGLDLDLLNRTPSTTLSGVGVADSHGEQLLDVARMSVSISAKALLGGSIQYELVQIRDAQVRLQKSESGETNWSHIVKQGDPSDTPAEDSSLEIPPIRSIEVDEVSVSYFDAPAGLSANLDIQASGSTLLDSTPSKISAIGEFNSQGIKFNFEGDSLKRLIERKASLSVDALVELGQTTISASGEIGDPVSFRELDITVAVEAAALDDLATLLDAPLPVIPPFEIRGDLKRDGDDFILRRFTGKFGDTDIAGDIRADQTTTPITLYANIFSDVLDLDDLAGFVGAPSDMDETAVVDDRLPVDSSPNKLLPDVPLNLSAMAEFFTGAIRYRASAVSSPVWPVDSLDVRVEIEPDRVALSPLKIGIAEGKFQGSVIFDLEGSEPAGTIEAKISQVNLKKLLMAAGIDDDSFGLLGGRLKFWMNGDTLRDLSASADGGIFLLMTGGKVDALLTELAGVDLVESITLLLTPGKTLTEIQCAYIDLHANNGVASFNRFVIDTDDTVFLADGSVDFNDESLDLVLEPHPKDISILAAQTSINIGGTFASPSVLPGSALASRAAAAAALAVIATPAAALLPFIQPSSSNDSPFCEGLIESVNDAR